MLVVSRKAGERILIGESIEITVLAIRGDQISLGVSAPREVTIHREELLDRIRRENRRAASLQADELRLMHERLQGSLISTGSAAPAAPRPKDAE
jgi:carbon storage regulator